VNSSRLTGNAPCSRSETEPWSNASIPALFRSIQLTQLNAAHAAQQSSISGLSILVALLLVLALASCFLVPLATLWWSQARAELRRIGRALNAAFSLFFTLLFAFAWPLAFFGGGLFALVWLVHKFWRMT
jgi:hypothetical protein